MLPLSSFSISDYLLITPCRICVILRLLFPYHFVEVSSLVCYSFKSEPDSSGVESSLTAWGLWGFRWPVHPLGSHFFTLKIRETILSIRVFMKSNKKCVYKANYLLPGSDPSFNAVGKK